MNNIRFDDNGFSIFLNEVRPNKIKSALKSGMRKSLGIIKRQAVSNLRQVTPNYKKKDKWGLTLQGGILVKVNKDGLGGRAEIMGRGGKANFKLKFFENGTKTRKTRKGYNRGQMKTTPFFTPAVNSTKSQVHEALQTNLDESLRRAYNKYAK